MNVVENAGNSQFRVSVQPQGRHSAIVLLSGELDLASASKLRDCLAELARIGMIKLKIDLANLTFLNSTGISILVTEFKRTSAKGGSLVVANVPPQAMKVFEIAGLVELLSIIPLEPHLGPPLSQELKVGGDRIATLKTATPASPAGTDQ